MTFGELEGTRTVMLVDMASDPSRLAESWGAVIGRIRQVHVLFIAPEAIDALSALEEVSAAELLQSISHRSLVPHVCTYLPNERVALVEHSLGSVSVQTRQSANLWSGWPPSSASFPQQVRGRLASSMHPVGVETRIRTAFDTISRDPF